MPATTSNKFGKAILDIRKEEWPLAIRMSAYFFLVITSFWILKPLKKTLFLVHYDQLDFVFGPFIWNAAQAELVAKMLNMVVAIVAVTVFSALANRYRRQQLSFIITLFFIAGYGVFATALRTPTAGAIWSFYLFGDLLSTLMVATFFAFLNDALTPDAAKRLMGLIGLGGVAGGVFGSSVLRLFVDKLTVSEWLGVTAVLGIAILFLASSAGRRISPPLDRMEELSEATPEAIKPTNPAIDGARLVMKSSYLISIAVMVGVYEIVSTILDFQFTSAVQFALDGDEIGRHIGLVYALTNGLALLVQIFLTSFVMRRFGLTIAISILPIVVALGSGGFLLAPTLLVGSFLSMTDNALNYSINQSSKETLYVPTRTEEKYKAKAFIDIFVQRFAKAFAVIVSLVLTTRFQGQDDIRWLSLVIVPLLVAWLIAARHAGKSFRRREALFGKAPHHDDREEFGGDGLPARV